MEFFHSLNFFFGAPGLNYAGTRGCRQRGQGVGAKEEGGEEKRFGETTKGFCSRAKKLEIPTNVNCFQCRVRLLVDSDQIIWSEIIKQSSVD